jgi:hypothetical protein
MVPIQFLLQLHL